MADFKSVPEAGSSVFADQSVLAMACSPEGIATIGGTAIAIGVIAFVLGTGGGLFGGRDGIPGGALDD